MSDSSTTQKLEIFATIKEGISIGMTNIVSIFVNVLLWVLTIWIPYLNVGTTIGLWLGIVSKASKGEKVPATEIFNPKYRKYMGEFFITSGLLGIGVGAGLAFGIIPGIVIGIAWSLAQLLVIDKGKNPTESITLSNNYTYGHKGQIFCVFFLVSLVFIVALAIFAALGTTITSHLWKVRTLSKVIGILFAVIYGFISLVMMFIFIGLQASIYKQLTENIRTKNTAAPAAAGGTFCPACGKKNPPGTKFCGSCGAQV